MAITPTDYFLVPPNWESSFFYRRGWQTKIQRTKPGIEIRTTLNTVPRRSIKYTINGTREEFNYVKRLFQKNIPNIWGVPIWSQELILPDALTNGDTTITLPSDFNSLFTFLFGDYAINGLGILFKDYENYEVVEINSYIYPDTFTIKSGLVNDWDAETKFYPILKSRLSSSQNIKALTSEIFDNFEVEFMDILDYEEILVSVVFYDFIGILDPPYEVFLFDTYKDRVIFNIEPNWVKEVEIEYMYPYNKLEYYGVEYYNIDVTESTLRLNCLFSFHNRYTEVIYEGVYDFLEMFNYTKGRFKAFWMPSYQTDIKVLSAFSATDITIVIEDIDWTTYYENNNMYGHYLYFRFPDGDNIVAGLKSSGPGYINLYNPIGKTILAEDLGNLQVCFLIPCRFDSDIIEIEYYTKDKGEISIGYQSLIDIEDVPNLTTTTTTTTTTSTTSSTTSTSSSTSTTFSTTSTSSSTSSSTTTNTQSSTTTSSTTTTNTQSSTTTTSTITV